MSNQLSPLVPIFSGHAVGIAVMSYELGQLADANTQAPSYEGAQIS